jgi:hypothetical protein
MFLATVNKPKQLLHMSFIGVVRVEELTRGREDVAKFVDELTTGFRVLADLGRLDSMETGCAPEIGKVMELCDQKGVGLVVRVIPDPRKDIGMNLISLFHYHHQPQTVICDNMEEAARLLFG